MHVCSRLAIWKLQTLKVINTVNVVILAGGKFHENVHILCGGNFHDTTPISFMKAYGFYLGIEFYLFVSHEGMKRQRIHV